MKVAFDHQIFSLQRYGGISRYFFELASRLPAHGVSEVSVVAPLYINNYLATDSAPRYARQVRVALPRPFAGIPGRRACEPVCRTAGMAGNESGHRARDLLRHQARR